LENDNGTKLPSEEIICGSNPVREALRRDRPITRVWLARDKKDRITEEVIGHCRKANIPFSLVDKNSLDRVCGNAIHQGIAAQIAPKQYTSWHEMKEKATEKGQVPLIVMLDEVEDPQNLGAALRSADALGAHGVVITKHRAAPLASGAARASAGAWEYVMVDRVTNISNTIEDMKKEGFWVIGATAEAGKSIYQMDWTVAVALVLGGEHKGLTPLIRKKCDELVSIPMSGQVNSLNVSAAAAVILSEIGRQRQIARQ
jgi:23S rRNA (guanosine2251-2'-O)-methyltransferase